MFSYLNKKEKMLINKPLLITGASGHIGFVLLKKIMKLYNQIYILVNRSNKELDFLAKENKIKLIKCDLTNKSSLLKYKSILKKIEITVHLAAYVPKNKDGDILTKNIEVNLIGSMNLISFLTKSKFIFISTCEVYGIPKTKKIKEDHTLDPLSYYGLSKLATEKALKIYAKEKAINLIILRLTNIYGPGETINRAIPNFIKSALQKKNIFIYGDGSDKRDYLYIDDAVHYIICAMKKGRETTYNLATGKAYTIKDIAKKIIKLSHHQVNIKFKKRTKTKSDYIFDIMKIKRDIGYVPKTSIEQGLLKEIEWFKDQNAR